MVRMLQANFLTACTSAFAFAVPVRGEPCTEVLPTEESCLASVSLVQKSFTAVRFLSVSGASNTTNASASQPGNASSNGTVSSNATEAREPPASPQAAAPEGGGMKAGYWHDGTYVPPHVDVSGLTMDRASVVGEGFSSEYNLGYHGGLKSAAHGLRAHALFAAVSCLLG